MGSKKGQRQKLTTLMLGLLLAGCTAAPGTGHIASGEYQAMQPWQSSDMRGKHVGLLSDIDIRIQLEKGLMDLSTKYFPPADSRYRTHVFLDYDELDATDGSRGLLGTLRDDNPNGLNPGSDEPFDTGNGVATGPILIVDLYEIDYYHGEQLSGIAIGLAAADAVTINGQRVEIGAEQMKSYLQATGAKINSYLRERFNEVTASIPVLVAAYQLNTNPDESSKGGYIYSEYFTGSQSDFEEISEEYLVVPSARFTEADEESAGAFLEFRSQVSQILPDTAYTTGEARFQNGALAALTLNVTAYGKTAGEILALVQTVQEKLSLFSKPDMTIKVIIKNNGDVCALMERRPNSTDVEVLSTY